MNNCFCLKTLCIVLIQKVDFIDVKQWYKYNTNTHMIVYYIVYGYIP